MIPKDVRKTKNPLNAIETFEILILKLEAMNCVMFLFFFLRKYRNCEIYKLIIIKQNSIITQNTGCFLKSSTKNHGHMPVQRVEKA